MITGDSYIGSNRQHRLSDQVSANTDYPRAGSARGPAVSRASSTLRDSGRKSSKPEQQRIQGPISDGSMSTSCDPPGTHPHALLLVNPGRSFDLNPHNLGSSVSETPVSPAGVSLDRLRRRRSGVVACYATSFQLDRPPGKGPGKNGRGGRPGRILVAWSFG